MRSSSGEYYLGLDQIRAGAAYLVFMWHFMHGTQGSPVPFHVQPIPPFVLVDEGHLGVSLFMCLSGYLFARLLQGRNIHYLGFVYNRLLRLMPLLVLVLLTCWLKLRVTGADDVAMEGLFNSIIQGWRLPSLPNGGWSVTVEVQFYIVLPVLLWLVYRFGSAVLLCLLLISIAFKAILFLNDGTVQLLSYLTLLGRLDQLLLGMWAAFALRNRRIPVSLLVFLALIFVAIYQVFDSCGGFYGCGGFPSKNPIWIFLPAIEGLFFMVFITWYDTRRVDAPSVVGKAFARAGQWSYGLYLLHPFWVFAAASWWYEKLPWISNFYGALLVGTITYLASLPMAWLSWQFIEEPFLKHRVRYIKS